MATHSTTCALPDITDEETRILLAACDDSASHHIVYVTQDGIVHVTDEPRTPTQWSNDGDIRFRYETYLRGNGYVGKTASEDPKYVRKLTKDLIDDWTKGNTGFVDY